MSNSNQWFLDDGFKAAEGSLQGFCLINPDITTLPEAPNVVVTKFVSTDRPALVCGGGSGHEPAHAGFVSQHGLTAAVCGGVFASPSHKSIISCLRHIVQEQRKGSSATATGSLPGILVIIKNYGGDVINFSYAAEVVNASDPKANIRTIVIGDDVAFGTEHDGRRGIAGTCVLYHLLAAYIHQPKSSGPVATLEDVFKYATQLVQNIRSIGASFTTCQVPATSHKPDVTEGCVEIGLGIHGETGRERVPYTSASDLVSALADILLTPPTAENGVPSPSFITPTTATTYALLVNNLGCMTDIEMNVMTFLMMRALEWRLEKVSSGSSIQYVSTGRYMTALAMRGLSFTLLKIPSTHAVITNESILKGSILKFVVPVKQLQPAADEGTTNAPSQHAHTANPQIAAFTPILAKVCTKLLTHVDELNTADAVVGDGDTGTGLLKSIQGVQHTLLHHHKNHQTFSEFLHDVGETVADSFAGTSGPLLGAFLCAAAASYAANGVEFASGKQFVEAFTCGFSAVQRVGGAVVGDRTMVDVLDPLNTALQQELQAQPNITISALMASVGIQNVVDEATQRASTLRARKGRARYQGGKEVGHPDPGALMIQSIWNAVKVSI